MGESRTKNVARNSSIALVCQVIYTLLNFACRTIFIQTLNEEYLGVGGLFTNILTVLSFAELGIGNAIIFSMYRPVAIGDRDKIKSLMALYEQAYRIIGCAMAGAGLLVIPFLGFIIKEPPGIRENLVLVYLLYLAGTVSSYFFVYKKSIISAHQKDYVLSLYQVGFSILQNLLQIAALLLTGSFLLYLAIHIVCPFLGNVFVSKTADKMYPYLKDGKALPLPREERRDIFKNVRALVVYKLGGVVLGGTDNILISAMLGVSWVGICSNYTLVITAFRAFVSAALAAFTSSVGNLNAMESAEKKESVFNKLLLISVWIFGFLSVGLLLMFQDFITLWLSDGKYLLPFMAVFALVLHVYVDGVHHAAYLYRTTLGYFVQGRLAPLAAAVLNIALSILMCNWMGLAGIFFATSISLFLTTGIVDPILVYRKAFNKNPIIYYLKYFAYALLVAGIYFLLKYVIGLIAVAGILGFAAKLAVIAVLFNLVFVLAFFKTKNFRELVGMARGLIKGLGKS